MEQAEGKRRIVWNQFARHEKDAHRAAAAAARQPADSGCKPVG